MFLIDQPPWLLPVTAANIFVAVVVTVDWPTDNIIAPALPFGL